MLDPAAFQVLPGRRVTLSGLDTRADGGLAEEAAKSRLKELGRELESLQEMLFADGRRSLLVVFQALDGAGKDSTIRSVFGPVNPQGVQITNFKAPSETELSHDFLWRVHNAAPRRGWLGIFNRSHYEDVLVVRVKKFVTEEVWRPRYEQIRWFEQTLAAGGTKVLKFYLHISKEYQKRQFEDRLQTASKQWKFNPRDLDDRKLWEDFQSAYEEAFWETSTADTPWWVVPAERKWFRDLLVSEVVVRALKEMGLEYPKLSYDPAAITIE